MVDISLQSTQVRGIPGKLQSHGPTWLMNVSIVFPMTLANCKLKVELSILVRKFKPRGRWFRIRSMYTASFSLDNLMPDPILVMARCLSHALNQRNSDLSWLVVWIMIFLFLHSVGWECLKIGYINPITQWFADHYPPKKMAISLGIYPTFSDKPSWECHHPNWLMSSSRGFCSGILQGIPSLMAPGWYCLNAPKGCFYLINWRVHRPMLGYVGFTLLGCVG